MTEKKIVSCWSPKNLFPGHFVIVIPGEGGGGYSTKFYTGWLRPEVQTLTLLYTIFERKGTPFVYL